MPQATGPYTGRASWNNVTIFPSTAVTVTSAGATAFDDLGEFEQAVWQLDVTATLTDVGDTLDVYIQTSVDGTNWVDIVHFTQVLGNGNAKRFYAKTNAAQAMTMFENATALGAAAVRNIHGNSYRIRYDITDADADCSFTFSVKANFQ